MHGRRFRTCIMAVLSGRQNENTTETGWLATLTVAQIAYTQNAAISRLRVFWIFPSGWLSAIYKIYLQNDSMSPFVRETWCTGAGPIGRTEKPHPLSSPSLFFSSHPLPFGNIFGGFCLRQTSDCATGRLRWLYSAVPISSPPEKRHETPRDRRVKLQLFSTKNNHRISWYANGKAFSADCATSRYWF